MVIQFAKHADKAPTLTCVRDDGSVTWFQASNNGEFFAAHDLLHYAVETTLGYSTAFYGMIANGRDLNDFGTQGGETDARPYSDEALQAEETVGLIQVMFPPGTQPDFETFDEACVSSASKPSLTNAELERVHMLWIELLNLWRKTPDSSVLELRFPDAGTNHPAATAIRK